MYIYIDGNMFTSPAHTLVNTINTVGAMGKGLAKEFKRLFPDMFKEYQRKCELGEISIGKLWLYRTPNKWILNFPTKQHWRQPSQIAYIDEGLKQFVDNYNKARIKSIAFPKLGCGNGELEWEEVKPLMEKYLKTLPINTYVYLTSKPMVPEHKNIKEFRKWLLSEPRCYPFSELKSDLISVISVRQQFATGDIRFSTTHTERGLQIVYSSKDYFIPWEGDESGAGLLELWQFIRNNDICRLKDIEELGLQPAKCLMEMLKPLPYIKFIELISDIKMPAFQLDSSEEPLPLFKNLGIETFTKTI